MILSLFVFFSYSPLSMRLLKHPPTKFIQQILWSFQSNWGDIIKLQKQVQFLKFPMVASAILSKFYCCERELKGTGIYGGHRETLGKLSLSWKLKQHKEPATQRVSRGKFSQASGRTRAKASWSGRRQWWSEGSCTECRVRASPGRTLWEPWKGTQKFSSSYNRI